MKACIHTIRLATLVVIANPGFAAERAVEGTHIEFDVNSIDTNPSGAPSSGGLGLDMTATFPLGAYFGASLGGEYLRTRVRTGEMFDDSDLTQGVRPNCSFDSLSGEGTLMFRLPKYFRLTAGYSTGDLSADCTGDSVFVDSGRDRLSTEGLRFSAQAYWGDFTLGVERLKTSLGDGPELRSTTIEASWYPLESLKIGISGNDMYDAETYRLFVEHQPAMLGDNFGIRAAFSMSDLEPRTRTFEIGLSYYFGREIPLLTRDRAWR